MPPQPPATRYKVLRQLGTGDFATVYAARDTVLNRDVAVKQIHKQFLADKEKLSRYWQEAQLLASLEHPNVMTMYDIIPAQGCLVVELMQGSLKQIYAGRPMPLGDVRQTLIQAANGLAHLHQHGVIHGDIKPGNLLLSRQNLVKLGDFGLARRASDSHGSLLKGTARYMAPEMASEQFGPVGPASDLYSLGFSALEMMCGPEFDSLFPGLHAFGRDQQIAWMMWHIAKDRKLPAINTMLEGVPPDLAAVLTKLTAKDQAQRYRTAAEVIADLSREGGALPALGAADQEAAAAAEAEAKKKKLRRKLAIGGFAASLAMCALLLFMPESKPPAAPPPAAVAEAIEGSVQEVHDGDKRLVLAMGDAYKEIAIYPEDRILLNRKQRPLNAIKVGDRIRIDKLKDEQGKPFQEVQAWRPDIRRGTVARVQTDDGRVVLKITEGEDSGSDLTLRTNGATKITLNGQKTDNGRPVGLPTLKPGDRLQVNYVEDEIGPLAFVLDAQRLVQLEGYVRAVNLAKNELTLATSQANDAALLILPLAERCDISLNGLRFINNSVLTLKDIIPGDKVTIRRDVKIASIDAYRVLRQQGTIRRIAYETRTLELGQSDDSEPMLLVVPPDCKITLAGEVASLNDLRAKDSVELTSDELGNKARTILSLSATRPVDRRKWALVIANQKFDDTSLTKLIHPLADARLVRDRLVKRYAVPADQALLLDDESYIRWEQGIPSFLNRVPADSELYVYVTTHAYVVPSDTAYLATKDFSLKRMAETGVKLHWLLQQLDTCRSKQKLLFLDCTHAGTGTDLTLQPSTAEMVELASKKLPQPYLRTLFVLASSMPGQRGQTSAENPENSLFAAVLAEGFAGAADKARDNQLEITEISQFVERRVAELASAEKKTQTPKFYLANDRPPPPPRLTAEAKAAITRLLSRFNQAKIDPNTLRSETQTADRLANGQPEPMLVSGLVLTKAKQWDAALATLEQLRGTHTKILPANQAIAWIHFEKRNHTTGVKALKTMIDELPKPAAGSTPDEQLLALFQWTGKLRELRATNTWAAQQNDVPLLESLDKSVAGHGPLAVKAYEQGRADVQKYLASQMGTDPAQLILILRKLSNYATFDPEVYAGAIREGLEK